MKGPKLFGSEMSRTIVAYAAQYWDRPFGDWRLIVCTAADPKNGFRYAIEDFDGSTTIHSSYRPTAALAAKAIEEWLLGKASDVLRATGYFRELGSLSR